MKSVYLYEIECETYNHYYVGITTCPEIREEEHRSGGERCAKWLKIHGVRRFIVLGIYSSKKEALQAEYDRRVWLNTESRVVVSNGRFARAGQSFKKYKRLRHNRSCNSPIINYLKYIALPRAF